MRWLGLEPPDGGPDECFAIDYRRDTALDGAVST
jgi:hypothetical protein